MTIAIPSVRLSSGYEMPIFGLGTWLLEGKECTKVVQRAIHAGYTLVDTAHAYQNHKAIAGALREIARERLFLTSKLSLQQIHKLHYAKSVEKACNLALSELQVDYIDLYLLHWPDRSVSIVEILSAMRDLTRTGKVRSFGVCNCTMHHLQDLIDADIHVHVNQVEFHPYLFQKELWEFCKRHKIQLQSYRPLGKGALVKEPVFAEIGKKYQKSPAQVILRWLIQHGIPTTAKASSEAHLKENLAIFDFSLTKSEMSQLDALNRDKRYCLTDWADFDY